MNSWGRIFEGRVQKIVTASPDKLPDRGDLTVLARGNGRSYGDVALNTSGHVLDTSPLKDISGADWSAGEITVGAGLRLDELLQYIERHGWTLPVVPGTQYVTVGGCIANDVHGKNHHRVGSFGHHLVSIKILDGSGAPRNCSVNEHAELYHATIGGLGLTGLIVSATLQLVRLKSHHMQVRTRRFRSVGGFFRLSEACAADEYSVAWIDAASNVGRGVFQSANAASTVTKRGKNERSYTTSVGVPAGIPFSMVTSLTAPLLAGAYRMIKREGESLQPREKFLFPLDAIDNWNRGYGPKGFVQFQCVLPWDQAETHTMALLHVVQKARAPTFLTVLKQLGEQPSIGLLSFCRPGITLAVDFPYHGETTRRLLHDLEQIVCTAGGAMYPAKDAFMSGDTMRAQSPAFDRFVQARAACFDSDFARRVL